jgi:hypothetical protein
MRTPQRKEARDRKAHTVSFQLGSDRTDPITLQDLEDVCSLLSGESESISLLRAENLLKRAEKLWQLECERLQFVRDAVQLREMLQSQHLTFENIFRLAAIMDWERPPSELQKAVAEAEFVSNDNVVSSRQLQSVLRVVLERAGSASVDSFILGMTRFLSQYKEDAAAAAESARSRSSPLRARDEEEEEEEAHTAAFDTGREFTILQLCTLFDEHCDAPPAELIGEDAQLKLLWKVASACPQLPQGLSLKGLLQQCVDEALRRGDQRAPNTCTRHVFLKSLRFNFGFALHSPSVRDSSTPTLESRGTSPASSHRARRRYMMINSPSSTRARSLSPHRSAPRSQLFDIRERARNSEPRKEADGSRVDASVTEDREVHLLWCALAHKLRREGVRVSAFLQSQKLVHTNFTFASCQQALYRLCTKVRACALWQRERASLCPLAC